MNGDRQFGWGDTAARRKLVTPQIEARSNESVLPEIGKTTAIYAELLCKYKKPMTDKSRGWGGGGYRQTPPKVGLQCTSWPKQKYIGKQMQFMRNTYQYKIATDRQIAWCGRAQTDTPSYWPPKYKLA